MLPLHVCIDSSVSMKSTIPSPHLSCCCAGSGLTLQLIRRNQECNVPEALAPVDINLQYDFDYQQFTFLPNEVQLLPVSFNQCIVTVKKQLVLIINKI